MRLGKPAAALPWAALVACFLWTVYSHMNIRKLVLKETSSAYTRISEDIQSLEVSAVRKGRVELLEQATVGLLPSESNASSSPLAETAADYENLFFNQGFDNSTAYTHTYSSNPRVWLYSLITTDYHAEKLVPHYLRCDSGLEHIKHPVAYVPNMWLLCTTYKHRLCMQALF